jgi:hypothetical protein
MLPQFLPWPAHVAGEHKLAHRLFEHAWPPLQVPQLRLPPQPSEMLPQFAP